MNNFEYIQPKDISTASKYLKKNNNANPFAGGTDILGLLKDNIISPSQLVNLKNLDNLDYIDFSEKSGLRIGSLTKLSKIEKSLIVKEKYTALYEAITEIATPQLKNVGTIGGNICQRPRCFYFRGDYDCIKKGGDTCYAVTGNNKYHCIVGGDPCYIVHPSDTAVVLLAFDAKFKIHDGKNERIINCSDFFVLPENDDATENILNPGEILTEIIIPVLGKNTLSTFIKVKERGCWDFALVSIAGVFEKSGDIIKNGNIAFGGVAPIPWFDENINKNLNNFRLTSSSINNFSKLAIADAQSLPMNNYKVLMARNLIKKLLTEV